MSWLIDKGVPAEHVRRIAGRSSLAVTQICTHVPDASLIAAVERLDPAQVDLEVGDINRSISSQPDDAEMDTISRN